MWGQGLPNKPRIADLPWVNEVAIEAVRNQELVCAICVHLGKSLIPTFSGNPCWSEHHMVTFKNQLKTFSNLI
jgi:hypothetical protein